MLELNTVTAADFTPYLNEHFEVQAGGGTVPLQLHEVARYPARPESVREPFSLIFKGEPALRLPQSIYRLEHHALGTMEIFLTQVDAKPTGSLFEAVFN